MSESAAPWIAAQLQALLAQRGHAWLLQGASGLGQYELGLGMAQAWLCERPSAAGACGECASCHAVAVRTHADLFVLMPETVMDELGWPLSEKAQKDIDDKKRKASKQIVIEDMREAVVFSQRTSARGQGKAVLVYPAERMNVVTATALLKTLEEPPGDVKFVLASEAAHQLLPTIRSRCLTHSMVWPSQREAIEWLKSQGVDATAAPELLRAAGGRPADALRLHAAGRNPKAWGLLPRAMVRGDVGAFTDWSPPEAVGALQKLCHDLLAIRCGAAPRFFDPADLPSAGTVASLTAWSRELARTARTVEHPFQPGLMMESLVSRARQALNSRA
ncbi:DNA polymerase III subunit delta' [Ramlibacter sp.]|uniref:DNA polymerase III subunit delta' n=1 Tax=Ramlibacter sp. TaxID=1917967 RepID=UPI003D0EF2A0